MTMPPAPSIHVIGGNDFQNTLLVSFLEQENGYRCTSSRSLGLIPPDENGPSGKRLFLLDNESDKTSPLWKNDPVPFKSQNGKDLFALFNVKRDQNLEREAIERGMRGVFYSEGPLKTLQKGVQAILDGELWFPRRTLTEFVLNQSLPSKRVLSDVGLTFREKQILYKLQAGASNLEIGNSLNISIHTVKTHIYKIFKKIGVTSRLHARIWMEKNL
jgi:LuxR family transcriptional regulator, positive regulator of biofilm formation